MGFAVHASSRGTCIRKKVGAVIVLNKNVLATGYNGSISGQPHCTEAGCLMEDGHCVRTIHAEMNAILQAAKHGTQINHATLYTTASPCWPCFKAIANTGIRRIVFGEMYREDTRVQSAALKAEIELTFLKGFTSDREEGVSISPSPG